MRMPPTSAWWQMPEASSDALLKAPLNSPQAQVPYTNGQAIGSIVAIGNGQYIYVYVYI